MAQALLPLKDLVSAKTRLSGLLTSSERRSLAQAMVEDVLACLQSHPGIEGVTIVSDDPSAPHLAASHGAQFLDERSLGCQGLNPVLTAALERVPAAVDGLVIVLHGDLPAIATEDLDSALAMASDTDLVVGSDRMGTGTNMLVFRQGNPPSFAFGPDSCSLHQAWARASGVPCKNLQTYGIGFDIDVPGDLGTLLELARSGRLGHHTGALLSAGLGARLATVVASIGHQQADQSAMGDTI